VERVTALSGEAVVALAVERAMRAGLPYEVAMAACEAVPSPALARMVLLVADFVASDTARGINRERERQAQMLRAVTHA